MAAPVYNVDLIDVNLAETNTGWADINQAGGGGANSAEPDFAIQGTNAISRQVSNTRRGVMYDNSAGTNSLGGGDSDHAFIWTVCSTPGISDSKSNGGIRVMMGSSNTSYYDYYVNGNDTLPEGGMRNYAVRYNAANATATVGGTPGLRTHYGAQIQTTATARDINFACDAIRIGRGFYNTEGDATTPHTFSGSAALNDLNANRYGVLTNIPGGYSLTGKYVIGQPPRFSGTVPPTTASYFSDSNTSVSFRDTEEFCSSTFTQIEFDDPGTYFSLDSVTFNALGTFNKGRFLVSNTSTTGSMVSCTFNGIGRTLLNANVQVTGSTWRSCDEVIQSGSIIFDSTFVTTTSPSGSLVSNDPSLVTNTTFQGSGTQFGITVTTAGEYNFTGNKFSGFVSGSDPGAELLFDPPSGTGNLTLNILGGGDNVNFINRSSGTVTINNNIQVTLTGMKDFTEVRVLDVSTPSDPVELAGIENVVSASVGANDNDFAFSLAAGTLVDIAIISVDFVNQRITNFTIPSSDAEVPIQQSFDRNYSNPV